MGEPRRLGYHTKVRERGTVKKSGSGTQEINKTAYGKMSTYNNTCPPAPLDMTTQTKIRRVQVEGEPFISQTDLMTYLDRVWKEDVQASEDAATYPGRRMQTIAKALKSRASEIGSLMCNLGQYAGADVSEVDYVGPKAKGHVHNGQDICPKCEQVVHDNDGETYEPDWTPPQIGDKPLAVKAAWTTDEDGSAFVEAEDGRTDAELDAEYESEHEEKYPSVE